MPAWRCICVECVVFNKKEYEEDGIRTRASEEIGALNRLLRPTRPPPQWYSRWFHQDFVFGGWSW